MERSRNLTIAAVLQALFSVVEVVMAFPILAAGSAGMPAPQGLEVMGGPPFIAGVVFVIAGVAGLFGAYGLWKGQRWGKIVTIVTRTFFVVAAAGDVLGAIYLGNYLLTTVALLFIGLSIYVIYLVLRRERVPLPA